MSEPKAHTYMEKTAMMGDLNKRTVVEKILNGGFMDCAQQDA
jgi:hypothetical protein